MFVQSGILDNRRTEEDNLDTAAAVVLLDNRLRKQDN